MTLSLLKELQVMTKQGALERKAKIDKFAKEAYRNACDSMKSAARGGNRRMTIQIEFKGSDSFFRTYMQDVAVRVESMLADKGIKLQGDRSTLQGRIGVAWDEG
jgi:hypothetical protein